MSTTSTIDKVNRTGICSIFLGSDYALVKSPTGKTLVAMIGEDSDWSALPTEEQRLLNKLKKAPTTEVVLTFDELKLFQGLAQRFPDVGTTPPATPATAGVNEGKEVEAISITPMPAQETTSPVVPTIAPSVVVVPASKPHNATNGHIHHEEELSIPYSLDIPHEVEHMLRERKKWMQSLRSKSMDKTPLWEVRYYVPSAVSNPPDGSNREPMFYDMAKKMKRSKLAKFDGSCYHGRKENIPWDVIREVEEWNSRPEVKETAFFRPGQRLLVKIEAKPVAEAELQRIRDGAFMQLLDETMEIQESLLDSISGAAQRLDEQEQKLEEEREAGKEGPTHEKMRQLHDGRIKALSSAISAAKAKLADVLGMAEAFDETESLDPLINATRCYIMENKEAMDKLRAWYKEHFGK